MTDQQDLERALYLANKHGFRIESPELRTCPRCQQIFAIKRTQRMQKWCSCSCRYAAFYRRNRDGLEGKTMTARDKALADLLDVVEVLTDIVGELNPGANEQIRRIRFLIDRAEKCVSKAMAGADDEI